MLRCFAVVCYDVLLLLMCTMVFCVVVCMCCEYIVCVSCVCRVLLLFGGV